MPWLRGTPGTRYAGPGAGVRRHEVVMAVIVNARDGKTATRLAHSAVRCDTNVLRVSDDNIIFHRVSDLGLAERFTDNPAPLVWWKRIFAPGPVAELRRKLEIVAAAKSAINSARYGEVLNRAEIAALERAAGVL